MEAEADQCEHVHVYWMEQLPAQSEKLQFVYIYFILTYAPGAPVKNDIPIPSFMLPHLANLARFPTRKRPEAGYLQVPGPF